MRCDGCVETVKIARASIACEISGHPMHVGGH